jgi:hypothetical protein
LVFIWIYIYFISYFWPAPISTWWATSHCTASLHPRISASHSLHSRIRILASRCCACIPRVLFLLIWCDAWRT